MLLRTIAAAALAAATPALAADPLLVNGAGATFPFPLHSKLRSLTAQGKPVDVASSC